MRKKVVPMIHVPDVRATVDWYKAIGFRVLDTYEDGGEGLSFAMLAFGDTEVMFNSGGQPSAARRREVDLYVYSDDVDELHHQLKDRVDVVEGPHDTFYGMREFIIRDPNRFWITFGEESVFAQLMTGVRERNAELVRKVLSSGALKPETLTTAFAAALEGENKDEIAELLRQAGALPPAEVDPALLRSYVGQYKGEHGIEINVRFEDGALFAAPGSQQPLRLIAVDEVTFRPAAFDNYGTITFNVEAGQATGCALKQGGLTMQLKRAGDGRRIDAQTG